MYCRNCGKEVTEKADICPSCGVRLKTIQAIAESGKPIKQYYQEEFKKIIDSNETYKGKWNWAAFFINVFWVLLKGLWKSYLLFLPVFVIFKLGGFNGAVYLLAILGYAVVLGKRGTYMYYCKIVKNKEIFI